MPSHSNSKETSMYAFIITRGPGLVVDSGYVAQPEMLHQFLVGATHECVQLYETNPADVSITYAMVDPAEVLNDMVV